MSAGSWTLAWRVDSGRIEGVDVSGLGVALLASAPASETRWQVVIHIDDQATPAQEDVLLKLVTGQFGGAWAELARLVGEVNAIERSPIQFDRDGHSARLSIGAAVEP